MKHLQTAKFLQNKFLYYTAVLFKSLLWFSEAFSWSDLS